MRNLPAVKGGQRRLVPVIQRAFPERMEDAVRGRNFGTQSLR